MHLVRTARYANGQGLGLGVLCTPYSLSYDNGRRVNGDLSQDVQALVEAPKLRQPQSEVASFFLYVY